MQITPSNACGAAMLAAIVSQLGANAKINFYTGTKPAGPDTAVTTQVKLGTATCATVAGVVTDKTLTFNTITQDAEADATGSCTWARITTSADVAVLDVDASNVGGTGFLQMNTVSIVIGGPILVNSIIITI